MKRVTIASIAALGLFLGTDAPAQAQNRDRRDRWFAYQNYANIRRNNERIVSAQRQIGRAARGRRNERVTGRPMVDPIDRYVRQGRGRAPAGVTLPPIYAGGRTRGGFFMNAPFFNPPTTSR